MTYVVPLLVLVVGAALGVEGRALLLIAGSSFLHVLIVEMRLSATTSMAPDSPAVDEPGSGSATVTAGPPDAPRPASAPRPAVSIRSAASAVPVSPWMAGPVAPPLPAESPPPSHGVPQMVAPRPAAWTVPSGRASEPRPRAFGLSGADLEALLQGRLLAIVGGVALATGALFFLSLAFSRGWIGPEGRVLLGLAGSTALLSAAAWLLLVPHGGRLAEERRLLAHVLLGVGLGTTLLSIFAATRLYGLVPVEAGLIAALVAATAVAAVALRTRSQLIAGYGLVTALVAPVVLGASPTLITLLFVAAVLVGATTIALFRTWPWLPPLAFLLSVGQVAVWLGGRPDPALALAVLAAYWLLHLLAAGGEEFRLPISAFRPTSAGLLSVNAAFLVGAGLFVLDGGLAVWRGAFLVLVAVAHLGLGLRFLLTRGERDPFGLTAAGAGMAALTIAVPIQFQGPAVPMGWAAQAAAMAWIWSRRPLPHVTLIGYGLAALSVSYLVTALYPLGQFLSAPATGSPFLNPNGVALATLLACLGIACVAIRRGDVRIVLGSAALALIGYAVPFEIGGLARVAAWSVIAVAAVAVYTWLRRLGGTGAEPVSPLAPAAVAGTAWGLAVLQAAGEFFEPAWLFWVFASRPDLPFTDGRTVAIAILAASAWSAAAVVATAMARRWALGATVVLLAVLIPSQLPSWLAVIGWLALAVAVLLSEVVRPSPTAAVVRAVRGGAYALIAIGAFAALADVAGPERLAVADRPFGPAPLPLLEVVAAYLALAAAMAIAARFAFRGAEGRTLRALAGTALVFLASVVTVDLVARATGATSPHEEVQKQAQVALSVLWSLVGGVAFVAGLVRAVPDLRRAGLALFVLATAKVFAVDLTELDVAYRVLSLVALGLLLLGSAYLYGRLRPPVEGMADDQGR